MATSTLDTELTCSICLEFYRDPYQLPCMHSFCKQCLIEFTKSNITSEDDDGCSKGAAKVLTDKDQNVLECPECRHTVRLDDKGIDGLPKNFTLANIVKKYAKQEDKEGRKYPCDICDTEPPNNAVKSCLQCRLLYCQSCLPVLHPSKGKLKTHKMIEPSEHQYQSTETVSVEDSKIIDSLLQSVNDLEVLKRKIERNIRDIQTNMDSLQDTGGKKKRETQVVFDRLCTMLKAKEHQIISKVEKEVDEKTDALMLQLNSWRQFAKKVNKIIKDTEFAVNDFPRKTTKTELQTIKSRISDLEKTQIKFNQQNIAPTHDVESAGEIEEKVEALGNDAVKKKTNHVWNISVKLIPMRSGASISVAWTKMTGKDNDVIVECTPQNGIKERTIFNCIQGSQHTIENLRQDTAYDVYVTVHGESDTENNGAKFRTLKCVPCTPFTINDKKVSECTYICEDAKMLYPRYLPVSETKSEKYTRISGSTGTIDMLCGSNYWETQCTFSIPKGMKKGDYTFDIGICYKTTVDRVGCLYRNFNSYTVNVVKRGNTDIKLEFNRQGYDVDGVSEKIVWEETMMLHLGFYLNMDKRIFSVINATENRVIYTFENIKANTAHVPVLSHSNNESKPYLEIQLLTGLDITEIPSCLLQILQDQNNTKGKR